MDTLDKYDAAYERGYADGLAGRSSNWPLEDDAEINYRDGYADGAFKRRANEEDANDGN